MRSPRENLEWRLVSVFRSLGREAVRQGIVSFMGRDRERMAQGLLSKLQTLPLKDGRPDLSAIGDPAAVAKEWASELKLSEDELLDRLLAHIEAQPNG